MIEPTDEMKAAFRAAQEQRAAELVAEGAPLGAHDILDRGLAAVLAIVARDRCMEARGHQAVKVTEAAEHAFNRAWAAARTMPRHEGYATHDGLCAALRALGAEVQT